METFDHIEALRIGLASPEHIRLWSHGEVRAPETIHFRTHKPVQDGLFCERIFGPIRDWSCACGAHYHQQVAGLVCQTCGVELAPATLLILSIGASLEASTSEKEISACNKNLSHS